MVEATVVIIITTTEVEDTDDPITTTKTTTTTLKTVAITTKRAAAAEMEKSKMRVKHLLARIWNNKQALDNVEDRKFLVEKTEKGT